MLLFTPLVFLITEENKERGRKEGFLKLEEKGQEGGSERER